MQTETLNRLTTRVRQLIMKMGEVKAENRMLREALQAKDGEIDALRKKAEQLTTDYEHLKTARMMELTYGDVDRAKVRLTKLIKDVNKSLTILSDD